MLANTRVSMAAPDATIRGWREGFGIMLAQQQRQLEKLKAARAGAFEASVPRLDAMAEAIADQVNSLRQLFARIDLPALPPPAAAPGFNPHMGYVQLLRDWAWPHDVQNTEAVRAMTERHDGPWTNVLVLGAGAGGLAAQLHAASDAQECIALDLNPLPLLLFDRLIAGQDVDVWEFPAYPREAGRWAVSHRLRRPARTDGLVTWLADALALPFSGGSFDVVVTHWFLDRIGRDPATVASLVHRLLRPGGVWINRGPLLYEGTRDWFGRPDIAEVIRWVRALGFETGEPNAERVDYLNSPWSTQQRREEVYTFSATRPATEAWLDDDTVGVPKAFASSIAESRDPITAWCAKQLDGSRSIRQLAREIGERTKMPHAGAREGVHERLHRAWARASSRRWAGRDSCGDEG